MNRLLDQLPPAIVAALLSAFVAVLRVIYDREDTRPMRVFLEAMVCGGLTVTVCAAIKALGLDENWVYFCGGTIGYLGSARVRRYAVKIMDRKAKEIEGE